MRGARTVRLVRSIVTFRESTILLFNASTYLATDAQDEQHDEKQHCPEIGQRHPCHGFWVRDESQACPAFDHVVDWHAHLTGKESHNGENHESGEDRRCEIRKRHDNCVSERSKGEKYI